MGVLMGMVFGLSNNEKKLKRSSSTVVHAPGEGNNEKKLKRVGFNLY